MFTRGRKRKGSREMEIQRMCGVCARRTRTARVGRGSSPRERVRRAGHYRRRDKTGTRERGIRSVGRRRRYRRSPHTHARALQHSRKRMHTGPFRLAHYRLPDSHHELLEKSIEYKKSPWCARRAEPSPLLHPLVISLLLSLVLVLALSLSLSLSLRLFPALFCLPFAHYTLPASLAASLARAHARYLCSPLLAIKRGRARVYTLAIDGDRRHACTHDGQGRR